MLAITTVVASIVVSCNSKIGEADALDLSKTPTQRTFDVFAVQTQNGRVAMRLESELMEHFDTDSASYDTFPNGISVFGYTEDGLLESIIVADEARHTVPKDRARDEIWSAFGNVILHNVIEQETMETDTIYWDQAKKEVYTDCYVKMYSRQGFLQGFGMRSDDHVRNSILYRPFDGYGLVVQDTTAVIIDSVNFIGPFPKK
ncbi:MAG: LPS export ABC transporter periplasmic protein LptC [Bacteroidales bacterium]|jgi:LPS export ABC transporter protein LptC|nr:LPS export ABC transporter periplasmic protein LptC [Bacteroidales bacterium]